MPSIKLQLIRSRQLNKAKNPLQIYKFQQPPIPFQTAFLHPIISHRHNVTSRQYKAKSRLLCLTHNQTLHMEGQHRILQSKGFFPIGRAIPLPKVGQRGRRPVICSVPHAWPLPLHTSCNTVSIVLNISYTGFHSSGGSLPLWQTDEHRCEGRIAMVAGCWFCESVN